MFMEQRWYRVAVGEAGSGTAGSSEAPIAAEWVEHSSVARWWFRRSLRGSRIARRMAAIFGLGTTRERPRLL